MATTGRQSFVVRQEFFFFFFNRRFSEFVCVCACVGVSVVLSGGRDESEIEGGEVRGDAHPLNPPLLTGERSEGAGRSTAN